MKIGYYIHHSTLKAGGIFTYSVGILKLLLESDEIKKVFVVVDKKLRPYILESFPNDKIEILLIDRHGFFQKILFTIGFFLYELAFLYKSELGKYYDRLRVFSNIFNPYRAVSKSGIDLLHVPMQYSPIYDLKIPVITTLHDVQELHLPGNFQGRERLHRAIHSLKSVERADHLIVSFDHIRKDLESFFGIPNKKISVCPPPFHLNWFGSENATSEADLIEKYAIKELDILYPAASWIHKNHLTLIRAIRKLHDQGVKVNLTCTGNISDYYTRVLEPEISKLDLSEYVQFLGIVPEEDLIGLYKAVRLVVIPTKYEAGSGPLYEAMRLRTPVICANTTSLPDTISNMDFVFDPDDVDELARLIEKGLNDLEFRQSNVKNSESRLNTLSKANYIAPFLEAYRKSLVSASGSSK